jgi:Ricin-type beta-trefoil lectin domain
MNADGVPSIGETVYVASAALLKSNITFNSISHPTPEKIESISSFVGLFNVSFVVEGISVKSTTMKDLCLGIQRANENDDARAIQWPCVGDMNQRFDFHSHADRRFRIVAKHSSKCLTVSSAGNRPAMGSPVVQKRCKAPGVAQIWTLVSLIGT